MYIQQKKAGLFGKIVQSPSRVYGLCSNPVPVLGYVDTEIRLLTGKGTPQRLQILNTEVPTLLLGRQFMQKQESVEFDFRRGRIKMGNDWTQIECTVQGATPLARAQVVKQDEELDESIRSSTKELLNPELEVEKRMRVLDE